MMIEVFLIYGSLVLFNLGFGMGLSDSGVLTEGGKAPDVQVLQYFEDEAKDDISIYR